MRREALLLLEQKSREGHIDLYYGDESRVSETGYVPYGWQFDGEDICVGAQRGESLNVFGMVSRDSGFVHRTTRDNVSADFVIEFLDGFSLSLPRPTVVVLDNASVHRAKRFRACTAAWQEGGLYIFYLPPYSPHLNIVERVWKELKGRWLRPADYQTADYLFYAVNQALNAVGHDLIINFSEYTFNSD